MRDTLTNTAGEHGQRIPIRTALYESAASDGAFDPALVRSLLDQIPLGMCVALDASGTRTVANRRLEEMLGVTPTAESPERGACLRIFRGGEELDVKRHPLARAASSGESIDALAVEIARTDGTTFGATVTASPLQDGAGRVVGSVGLVCSEADCHPHGIAARISRELASLSGRWYQAIADALPEHVWACTETGETVFCNGRTLQYTGRPMDEHLGKGWMEFVHPDDREYVKLAWKIAFASRGTFDAEFRLRRADGEYRWFHARGVPVIRPDSETVVWFGTSTDIDDGKREGQHASILRAIVREFSVDQDVGLLIERIARHCLGTFASFCIFDLYDRDVGLVRLAFVHVDSALEARLRDAVFESGIHATRLNDPIARVIRERKLHVARIKQSGSDGGSPDLRANDSLAAIENASKVVVPVCEPDGELVGVLTFGETRTDASRLDERNAPFAEEIARLMTVPFVRARNAARELRQRRTIDEIVRSSLPVTLPTTAAIALDGVHAAGRTRRDVGAAWYDAVWLADGRLMLSTGSVAGRGIEAALAMAVLRQTLRAAAFVDAHPVPAIKAADRVLRSLYAERYAAAFIGLYDPELRTMRYALAGHPPPVLRLEPGSALQLPGAGTAPLGFGDPKAPLGEFAVQFARGALLVLNTGCIFGDNALPEAGHNLNLTETIAQLDVHERPAAALLDAFTGTAGCSNDVAVLTALFR